MSIKINSIETLNPNIQSNNEVNNNREELDMTKIEVKEIETPMVSNDEDVNEKLGSTIKEAIKTVDAIVLNSKRTKSSKFVPNDNEGLEKVEAMYSDIIKENEELDSNVKRYIDIKLVKNYDAKSNKKVLLVVINFKKDSEKEPLVITYRELMTKSERVMDQLMDSMVTSNISAKSILNYVEELYNSIGVKCDDNTLENCSSDLDKASDYYSDLMYYITENPDEFVTLESNTFDENDHKGVYLKNGNIAVTNEFLQTIFVAEDYSSGDIINLSSNRRGQLLNVLKYQGLLTCPLSSRKDIYRHLREDKKDKKRYVYIFKLHKSLNDKEVA